MKVVVIGTCKLRDIHDRRETCEELYPRMSGKGQGESVVHRSHCRDGNSCITASSNNLTNSFIRSIKKVVK